MIDLLVAPAIMLGLSLLFGVILAVAYRLLRVEEDPRITRTVALLPGSNCGACGEPGCLPFAQRLIEGELQPSNCPVASEDVIDEIAAFLGVDVGDADKLVARLHCAGGKREAYQIAEYDGFESCRAAAVVSGGGKGCSWGCLGLADCEVSCDFDAIHMNDNGLPVVDTDRCTSCGDCVDACPKDLFTMMPQSQKLMVQCNIPLAGERVTQLCSVGCDGCGKCAADAPTGQIVMVAELPIIHYHPNSAIPLTPKPTLRCPTGSIQWVEQNQFDEANQQQREIQRRYAQLS